MRNASRLLGCALLAAASVSCGDVSREGRSPVYLTIDSMQGSTGGGSTTFGNTLFSDVQRLVTTGGSCTTVNPCPTVFSDTGQVTMRIVAKDATGLPTPTSNNEVTITRYHVNFWRSDGRKVQGTDVPYAFDGAVTALVPATAAATIAFEVVRHSAKGESPLVQLIRSPTIISAFAEVTFYGKDRVGNDVTVTGTLQVDFGNFGDS